jgi:hypothetical protein
MSSPVYAEPSSNLQSPPLFAASTAAAASPVAGRTVRADRVGIVFLLGTMHILSDWTAGAFVRQLLAGAADFWGVIKLIEHQRHSARAHALPGIGAGGIVPGGDDRGLRPDRDPTGTRELVRIA